MNEPDDLSWIDPELRKHLSETDIDIVQSFQRRVAEYDDTKIDIEAAYCRSTVAFYKILTAVLEREQQHRDEVGGGSSGSEDDAAFVEYEVIEGQNTGRYRLVGPWLLSNRKVKHD